MTKFFTKLCLQLFAEGAAVGGEGTAAGTDAGGINTAEVAAQPNGSGENSTVLSADAPGAESEVAAQDTKGSSEAGSEDSGAEEDIEKEYREAVRGKYKKARQKDFDAALAQRTRKIEGKYKSKAESFDTITPALMMYAEKLGVDPSDTAALAEAMQNDPDMVRREALDSGDDPTAALEKKRRRIADSIETQRREKAEAETAVRKQIDGWMAEAEKLKEEFPDFDLISELSGEGGQDFMKSLKFGRSVRDTYVSQHLDQIMSGAVAYTARAVKEATAKNIASRGMRPVENGASAQAAAVSHIDVQNLSGDKIKMLMEEALKSGKPVPLR